MKRFILSMILMGTISISFAAQTLNLKESKTIPASQLETYEVKLTPQNQYIICKIDTRSAIKILVGCNGYQNCSAIDKSFSMNGSSISGAAQLVTGTNYLTANLGAPQRTPERKTNPYNINIANLSSQGGFSISCSSFASAQQRTQTSASVYNQATQERVTNGVRLTTKLNNIVSPDKEFTVPLTAIKNKSNKYDISCLIEETGQVKFNNTGKIQAGDDSSLSINNTNMLLRKGIQLAPTDNVITFRNVNVASDILTIKNISPLDPLIINNCYAVPTKK